MSKITLPVSYETHVRGGGVRVASEDVAFDVPDVDGHVLPVVATVACDLAQEDRGWSVRSGRLERSRDQASLAYRAGADGLLFRPVLGIGGSQSIRPGDVEATLADVRRAWRDGDGRDVALTWVDRPRVWPARLLSETDAHGHVDDAPARDRAIREMARLMAGHCVVDGVLHCPAESPIWSVTVFEPPDSFGHANVAVPGYHWLPAHLRDDAQTAEPARAIIAANVTNVPLPWAYVSAGVPSASLRDAVMRTSPHLRAFGWSGTIEVTGALPAGTASRLSTSMLRLDLARRLGRTTFGAIEPRTRTVLSSLLEALGEGAVPDEARAILLARQLSERVGTRVEGRDEARTRLSHAGYGAAQWAALRELDARFQREVSEVLLAEMSEEEDEVCGLVM